MVAHRFIYGIDLSGPNTPEQDCVHCAFPEKSDVFTSRFSGMVFWRVELTLGRGLGLLAQKLFNNFSDFQDFRIFQTFRLFQIVFRFFRFLIQIFSQAFFGHFEKNSRP